MEIWDRICRMAGIPRDTILTADPYNGYPTILGGDHAEFELEWAGRDPKERPDWPLPSFDARDWAQAFMKSFGHRLHVLDEETMTAWFANALMRGYDQPRQ